MYAILMTLAQKTRLFLAKPVIFLSQYFEKLHPNRTTAFQTPSSANGQDILALSDVRVTSFATASDATFSCLPIVTLLQSVPCVYATRRPTG